MKQPFLDAIAQYFITASREVGTPDATTKQCIAREDPTFDFGIKADATLGMTRGANDLQSALPYLDDFAILQAAVGQLAFAIARHPK